MRLIQRIKQREIILRVLYWQTKHGRKQRVHNSEPFIVTHGKKSFLTNRHCFLKEDNVKILETSKFKSVTRLYNDASLSAIFW